MEAPTDIKIKTEDVMGVVGGAGTISSIAEAGPNRIILPTPPKSSALVDTIKIDVPSVSYSDVGIRTQAPSLRRSARKTVLKPRPKSKPGDDIDLELTSKPVLKNDNRNTAGLVVRDGKEEWLVEKIVGYRKIRGSPEYRIKWMGFNSSYNTWEPLQNVEHCMGMIDEFMLNESHNIVSTASLKQKNTRKRRKTSTLLIVLPPSSYSDVAKKVKEKSTVNTAVAEQPGLIQSPLLQTTSVAVPVKEPEEDLEEMEPESLSEGELVGVGSLISMKEADDTANALISSISARKEAAAFATARPGPSSVLRPSPLSPTPTIMENDSDSFKNPHIPAKSKVPYFRKKDKSVISFEDTLERKLSHIFRIEWDPSEVPLCILGSCYYRDMMMHLVRLKPSSETEAQKILLDPHDGLNHWNAVIVSSMILNEKFPQLVIDYFTDNYVEVND